MRGKDSRYTYMIFALLCLIIFNLGTIFISAKGSKSHKAQESNIKPVFSQEDVKIRDDGFFVTLLSRTSSTINLYKNLESSNNKWESSFYNKINLKDRFSNFFEAQFPSIIPKNYRFRTTDANVPDYEDMEEGSIIEDFIIIDRVEEYEDLIIISDSEGNITLENIPKPLNIKPLKTDRNKPYILIYHTHGTEAYSNQETNLHHTTDRMYNVTTIGENVAKVLEEKGHKVEHVSVYHDIPSYNKSYSRSLNTATEKLQENNNLKILLDIHRDGIDLEKPEIKKNLNKYLKKFKTKVNGKDVATFYFVIGPDSPNKEEVLSFAKYFKAVSDIIYPDLCTGILIKPKGKYNQFLSDYSALVEIGSNINTMEEALETAKLFGELLDIVIQNIGE